MSKLPDELGRLIAAAARAALLPLGCKRVGRSRTWISDQRYWLIVIEFQPSSWQKGSYLNVGAMWLWREFDGLAFNAGYRIADFVPFFSREQFAPVAADFAARAANEVQRLRKQFRTLPDIYQYLIEHTSEEDNDIFYVATVAGLVGDTENARRLFRIYDSLPFRNTQWMTELRARNALLAAQLDRPAIFRASVLETIGKSRALNNLPPDPGCLDGI
jgi:hypothetical protein